MFSPCLVNTVAKTLGLDIFGKLVEGVKTGEIFSLLSFGMTRFLRPTLVL